MRCALASRRARYAARSRRSSPRRGACRAPRPKAPTVTKPPKLVKFVAAVYPKDKHDAGITAAVLLSIEIGADGKVGEVDGGQGAPAPDFDAAAVAAAKQFVFEPAEIDGKPAPVKITYKYDFTDRRADGQGRAADQLRRRGARALQEEAAARA